MEYDENSRDVFRINFEVLRTNHPHVAQKIQTVSSHDHYELIEKNHRLTMVVHTENGPLSLQGEEDPLIVAARRIDSLSYQQSNVFLFLGLELGYTLESLVAHHGDSIAALVMIEKDIHIFYHFLHRRDWRSILSNPSVRIVIPEKEEEIIPAVQSFLPQIMGCGFQILEHPASFQLHSQFYRNARELLHQFLRQAEAEADFLLRYGKLIQRNAIVNLQVIIKSEGLISYKDYFKNRPAVLIAAGPSLIKNLHCLAAHTSKGLIFCVDTAYRIVKEYGIEPDFVAATDPTELNQRHFEGIEPDERTVLLFESDVYPSIPTGWKGPLLFINSAKAAINRWIEESGGPYGLFDQSLSVAHALFTAASWMGCNPVILVGHDLAYSTKGGTTHASGTALNRSLSTPAQQDKCISVHPAAFHPQKTQEEIVWIPGVFGDVVPTSKPMHVFLRKLSYLISKSELTVYDATEGGARIEGTEITTLSTIVQNVLLNSWAVEKDSGFSPKRNTSFSQSFVESLNKLASELKTAKSQALQGLSLAAQLNHRSRPSENIKNTPEWQAIDALFWRIYRNNHVQISLEQALFPAMYSFIQHPRNESDMSRLQKYADFFRSVEQLSDEFIGYLSKLISNLK